MAETFYGKRPLEDEIERGKRPGETIDRPRANEPVEADSPRGWFGRKRRKGGQQKVIGEKEIQKAATILNDYKTGKSALESRVINDELWWELRHWQAIGKRRKPKDGDVPEMRIEPTSAWLFNGILNKHADAMDNYPEPIVLPRERSDEHSAKMLSEVLPVIMEYNHFEQTYDRNWWEKLKHGTAVYGVFWNSSKENGLGDVDIRQIDLLNIFWEPGITDIQDSRNLFITQLVDNDVLCDMYPQLKDKQLGNVIDVAEYLYDDDVDTSDKSVVVDWYYKVKRPDGRTVLHFVKFVGNTLLYASENEDEYRERGYYDHGLYPVVFDTLFPEKGTPVGFGYVAISKDPQIYIDKLSANIMESSIMGTKPRFFISKSTAINEQEFLDWSKPLVRVEGELGEERIRQININPVAPIAYEAMKGRIEEMKDTTANRDVNAGSPSGGVTAAAAIAALQEAGNKVSRDMIAASYRSFIDISALVIELIRQFYDESRGFRITGEDGQYEFIDVNNAELRDQIVTNDSTGEELWRKPVFDLKIKALKTSPFSRMEMNERAKELYQLGFFAPERAQEALGAIEMMDFEGIDKVKDYIKQGDTLLKLAEQQGQQLQQLAAMMGLPTGAENAAGGANAPTGTTPSPTANGDESGIANAVMAAQTPMTSYGQRLAARSAPNMDISSNAANPGAV